ncbi:MAG: DUF5723 family protein [Lutibacter sp.]|nr:DUF5723 family protein [Lutibacter sp.]
MKKLPHLCITLFICCFNIATYAQSYFGYTLDNYSGIHGVTINPANIVDSPFKADINLVSASFFGGSDYLSINIQDILKAEEGFSFDDNVKKFPKDDNNFFLNADILGPSFMFNINKKSSIGFTSRVRTVLNINNINGELYESLADGFDETNDFDLNIKDFNGTIHAWAEVGLTYGRILIKNEQYLLKGGITLKYLQGAGAAFFNAPSISGQYDASANSLNTMGSLNYGLSQEEFKPEDLDFKNLTAGLGADIGLAYQWQNKSLNQADESKLTNYSKYKLKLGLSVTDIGSVNYKESKSTKYDLNQNVDVDSFDEDDTEQVLEDLYDGVTTYGSTKIKLPTAFNLLIDYQIKRALYLSLASSISLVDNKTAIANSVINTLTIAPRLETKWFSIYSPISFRQYGDFAWGAGLRFGPITIGSGSLLTNLFSDTKSADFYFGLKMPIYRKLLKKV